MPARGRPYPVIRDCSPLALAATTSVGLAVGFGLFFVVFVTLTVALPRPLLRPWAAGTLLDRRNGKQKARGRAHHWGYLHGL